MFTKTFEYDEDGVALGETSGEVLLKVDFLEIAHGKVLERAAEEGERVMLKSSCGDLVD